ncbi:carbamoyltransferase N-terminal domain-containing protein [Xanthocytophaga agilis]|uniref:Carbamoyltransferase N-terminal domain-containing protein n=1 Tax=Xanthocytophaga agilis TaxID=3048010 RepID=A0AAE3UHC1_9BACT|nr:carbamoyltransferase N-terminal domain-containing protein [Xanthocytophaga agilis]MDJ1503297.1 carbamoyltransferase N-terminal domain-containing protein [Xanthocytophaga agilis]
MRICGLKLTHDSSIALIENNELKFCIELEKVNNNNRFKIIEDLSFIENILNENGYRVEDIDQYVVDGWVGEELAQIQTKNLSLPFKLPVAPYQQTSIHSVSHRYSFTGLPIGNKIFSYTSYSHVAGHIFSCYCTSPFAADREDSYVLVWDGGMFPKLYFISGANWEITYIDELFQLGVNIYSIFSQHFGPFKINENVIKDELSVAGKVMAFSAFGKQNSTLIKLFHNIYQSASEEELKNVSLYPYHFTTRFREELSKHYFYDEDILASFHGFLQEMLIDNLSRILMKTSQASKNLCYSGGAALNIKWNNALRSANFFDKIWICPFPNDSGSAIGTACSEWLYTKKYSDRLSWHTPKLDWDVYKGPKLLVNKPYEGWEKKNCTLEQLAHLLHDTGEPVIFLQSRAELGPRALGNRSILCSASSIFIKDILNQIKYRESYRPIAPVCLEDKASTIFRPGGSDPFMLFEHHVSEEWQLRIPSICHTDQTARLQTVNWQDNETLYSLLTHYYKLTGIPVLCNTSANFKGSGFFPDINSATRWGKVNYVWAEGILYEKLVKNVFMNIHPSDIQPANLIYESNPVIEESVSNKTHVICGPTVDTVDVQ